MISDLYHQYSSTYEGKEPMMVIVRGYNSWCQSQTQCYNWSHDPRLMRFSWSEFNYKVYKCLSLNGWSRVKADFKFTELNCLLCHSAWQIGLMNHATQWESSQYYDWVVQEICPEMMIDMNDGVRFSRSVNIVIQLLGVVLNDSRLGLVHVPSSKPILYWLPT